MVNVCTTYTGCLFYSVREHGMYRQMQSFCAVKLPSSGTPLYVHAVQHNTTHLCTQMIYMSDMIQQNSIIFLHIKRLVFIIAYGVVCEVGTLFDYVI